MKIGVCVPTRGDRPDFLEFCRRRILQQTRLPDEIVIVDFAPVPGVGDLTLRYKTGCAELIRRGVDLIVFMEDDDWYHQTYIEIVEREYNRAKQPLIFGFMTTIYYHLFTQKRLFISHPGRASMFCTAISARAFQLSNFEWCDDSYPYLDMHLWQRIKGVTVPMPYQLAIGIKHGIGMTGGGGHDPNWQRYVSEPDRDFAFLRNYVGADIEFYERIVLKSQFKVEEFQNDNTFLTVVTRKYKRPKGMQRNLQSMREQTFPVSRIEITDEHGYGLHQANKAFRLASPYIKSDYVYLLDDDDFFVDAEAVRKLSEFTYKHNNPDVVVFRMIIKTGDHNNYYPAPKCWNDKRPYIAQIGGSCFIVKSDVWKKHINEFGQPRCGDFAFINRLHQSGYRFEWFDHLIAETGKVSKGKPE